jgi:hypothetical protein
MLAQAARIESGHWAREQPARGAKGGTAGAGPGASTFREQELARRLQAVEDTLEGGFPTTSGTSSPRQSQGQQPMQREKEIEMLLRALEQKKAHIGR